MKKSLPLQNQLPKQIFQQFQKHDSRPLADEPVDEDSLLSEIEEEHQLLENQAFAQDISLKKVTLILLFIFLAAETVSIFLFAYFQAVRFQNFHLDEWSFRLLVAATISQITLMVQLAVKHLFPEKK